MIKQKLSGNRATNSGVVEPGAVDPRNFGATESAVAQLRPNSLVSHVLPDMRAEFRAIRQDTEGAADSILRAVEALFSLRLNESGGSDPEIARHATAILEACAFQDLVGQRLSKVDRIAEDIEARLKALTAIKSIEDATEVETIADSRRRNLHLHGPALGGPDVEQSKIDMLFSE